ncbi:MAG: DNA-binding response regulator [Cyclobacteriaceae bacterium]
MNKTHCIIIEDEKAAQEILTSFLSRTEWIVLAGTFDDAISALEFLKRNEVDLVFLDIQIPGLNGIEFLKIIKNPPQIIITSAYSEYTLEAFELDVRDYLMKPFAFERYLKAVNKITPRPELSQIHQMTGSQNPSSSFAFFNVNKRMVRVQFSEILYVESMREYISINTGKEKVITKMGIGEIEKALGEGFVRVHRSFIANVAKVTAYSAEEVFIEKISLPIGPNYKRFVEITFGKQLE